MIRCKDLLLYLMFLLVTKKISLGQANNDNKTICNKSSNEELSKQNYFDEKIPTLLVLHM